MNKIYQYKNSGYFVAAILFIAFVMYIIQIKMFFNPDVASLLYDTKLFLAGGTYVKDFFETNPPMILILYSPIVLLQQWLQIDMRIVLNAYLIFLVFGSLYLTYRLLLQIIDDKNASLRYAIICGLIYMYLIFPIYDFGQREFCLMVLIMPYVLSIALRAMGKSPGVYVAICIGVMAGVGFSLKPFFLFPLVFLEIYLMVKSRNLWSWVRIEPLIILTIMVFYLAFIRAFHQNYFDIMLPLISRWYFLGTQYTWLETISKPRVVFCMGVAVYYLLFIGKKNYSVLSQVFMLSLVGFILAFMLPRTPWNYHVLPAYTFALILCIIIFYQVILLDSKMMVSRMTVMFAALAIFAMPILIHGLELKRAIDSLQFDKVLMLKEKIKKLNVQSAYCYSTTTVACFSFLPVNNMPLAGRFPLFWWISGMNVAEAYPDNSPIKKYLAQDKKYFSDALAADLNQFKPDVVITLKTEEEYFLAKGKTFPEYFSEFPLHREAWSHYQLYDQFGIVKLYRRVT